MLGKDAASRLPKDLVAASAGPLLLSILCRGESYGYAIIGSIRELSKGDLEWSDGMLYPLLHRLEQQGLILAKWRTAESGRRRKYYRITRKGREALGRQKDQWALVHEMLSGLWKESYV